jgi:hypothetical protein
MATRKNAQDIRIDDLKGYMGEQFSLVIKGQEALFRKFDDHTKEDQKQFDNIEQNFKNLEIKAAQTKGEAVQAAKDKGRFWGLVTGVPSAVLAGSWELWKYLHGVK